MKNRKYKNRTTINRSTKSSTHYKKSFSMDIFRDKKLSFTDIGLLLWLLSNSKDFIINKNNVQIRSGIPEEKFLNSWRILQELGYIEKKPIQGGVDWVINELPISYTVDNK